jgi:phage terminase large subunit
LNFIKNLCAGKNRAWIRKYIDCYLDVKEGAVYSNFMANVIEPIPIPDAWKRIYGFDKGFRDETAMLCGAIDPMTGVIYIYDEYYVAEQPMSYHAVKLKEKLRDYTMYLPIQADPTVKNRNERDGDPYQKFMYSISGGSKGGIWLEAANNNIDIGIEKVRNYFYDGKLKIFTTCDNLKTEARDYIYKPLDKTMSSNSDKPVDKNNHLMDCIRYLISPLPQNPNDFNMVFVPGINVSYDLVEDLDDDDFYDDGSVVGGFKLWNRQR